MSHWMGAPHQSQSSLPTSGTSRVRPSLNSCVTKHKLLQLSQRWRVENFASLIKASKPGNCLRSHVFGHDCFPDIHWQLFLFPNGKREEDANNVSLYLNMSATTPSKEVLLKAEYRFYFMDDSDRARFSNVYIGNFHAKSHMGGRAWGLRKIPRQKVLNSLRDDGSLMVLCEIEMLPNVEKVRCQLEKPTAVTASPMSKVSSSFVDCQLSLMHQGVMSDCSVAVYNSRSSSKQFSAHTSQLAALSEAFSMFCSMFTHANKRESIDSRLVFKDFSLATVRAMFKYAYSGRLDATDLSEQAEELMGLSEKYGLLHLKSICQDFLVAQIDQQNVCQLLAIADLYDAMALKNACVAFVGLHKDVMATDKWAVFKKEFPNLVIHVLETLVSISDCNNSL